MCVRPPLDFAHLKSGERHKQEFIFADHGVVRTVDEIHVIAPELRIETERPQDWLVTPSLLHEAIADISVRRCGEIHRYSVLFSNNEKRMMLRRQSASAKGLVRIGPANLARWSKPTRHNAKCIECTADHR